ncbi:hypothetical protein BH10PLA2_BH10PLA2_26970 [soil metagenome]
MRITKAFLLAEPRASEMQITIFEDLFPEGAELTADTLAQAREWGFDLEWLLCNKFPETMRRRNETTKQMWAVYQAKRQRLLTQYQAACDALLVACLVEAGAAVVA